MDPYGVLGVHPYASDAEVRAAFRKKALEWHPDRNTDNAHYATGKFKEITAAYERIQSNRTQSIPHNPYRRRPYPSSSTSSSTYSNNYYRRTRADFRYSHAPNYAYRRTGDGGVSEWWRGLRGGWRASSGGSGMARGAGIGATVVLTGMAVYGYVWATEWAWRMQNRGKSFEELNEARRKRNMILSRGFSEGRRYGVFDPKNRPAQPRGPDLRGNGPGKLRKKNKNRDESDGKAKAIKETKGNEVGDMSPT